MTSSSKQSGALSEYDMSEFSSWVDVIIDLTSRHSQLCADIEVGALLNALCFSWTTLTGEVWIFLHVCNK